MADNPPGQPPKVSPPLPSSGRAGQLKSPTAKLPPVQKTTATGKVVVMLSSVAKPASAGTQQLPRVPAPVVAPPKVLPAEPVPAPPAAAPKADAVESKPKPPPLPTQPAASGMSPPPVAETVKASPATIAKPEVQPPAQGSSQPRLSSTTHVKLPPKTAVPSLVSLTGKQPVPASRKSPDKVAPPLLPSKRSGPIAPEPAKPSPTAAAGAAPPLGQATMPGKSELKKTGPVVLNPAPGTPSKADPKKPGVIKLNAPTTEQLSPGESIFAQPEPAPPKPDAEGWKRLQPGELPGLPANLKDSDLFAHSQRLETKPPPVSPVGHAKPPALTPAAGAAEAKAGPALNPAPMSLPAKPAEPPSALHVAPRMTEKAQEAPRDKLPPPHFPEPTKGPDAPGAPVVKAPALVSVDPASAKGAMPPPLPAPGRKDPELKNSVPITAGPPAKVSLPAVSDSKPALKPAVLPKRFQPIVGEPAMGEPISIKEGPDSEKTSKPVETILPPREAAKEEAAGRESGGTSSAKLPAVSKDIGPAPADTTTKAEPRVGNLDAAVASTAAVEAAAKSNPPSGTSKSSTVFISKLPEKKAAPISPVISKATSATAAAPAVAKAEPGQPARPATRAARAKSRRLRAALLFWLVLVPAAAAGLFMGILNFGRDTRVEGQVIPPEGMSVSDEVWIVSNFSDLATGVADDLAKERVPLQREIQERRDHVQRAQADIAAREERIRLIQADMQATKDEIAGVVKKSREDTQALWDGEGAQIDAEYQSHLQSLQHTIAQRAASLKLPYQPDPAFPSPEVWANAYRLALYQVPPGVDGVKEHQWVGDQVKQWREFLKTLDDRKEQLREKAAQIKIEPAPRIADLNAKIDDLNQRIQGTQAEEEPIKTELSQAQAELAKSRAEDASLDEKFYKQLYRLPGDSAPIKIPIKHNGRFTWLPDNAFAGGQKQHRYLIFSRAVRGDGRQYWALFPFTLYRDRPDWLTIEPGGYLSTKAILRPDLSPEEQEQ